MKLLAFSTGSTALGLAPVTICAKTPGLGRAFWASGSEALVFPQVGALGCFSQVSAQLSFLPCPLTKCPENLTL